MDDKIRTKKEKTYWNKLSVNYDRFIQKHWNIYNTVLLEKIENNVKSGAVVLDVACGTGLVSEKIAGKSKEVISVDMSENMIAQANIKKEQNQPNNISFNVEDAYKLSLDENSCDTVVCINALHNTKHPEKAFSEIKRVLKPEGKLIVSIVGLGTSFKIKVMFSIVNLLQKTPLPVFHNLNLKQAVNLVKDAGFKVENSELLKDKNDMMPLLFIVANH